MNMTQGHVADILTRSLAIRACHRRPFRNETLVLRQVEQKIHELESQSRVNAAQAGEIEAQAAEIELHRKEIFDLKQ